jgi:G:T/U-mismatch repair DNA glycosylase
LHPLEPRLGPTVCLKLKTVANAQFSGGPLEELTRRDDWRGTPKARQHPAARPLQRFVGQCRYHAARVADASALARARASRQDRATRAQADKRSGCVRTRAPGTSSSRRNSRNAYPRGDPRKLVARPSRLTLELTCVNGKGVYLRAAGVTNAPWGRQSAGLTPGTVDFVVPSSSGLARIAFAEKLRWYRELRGSEGT